MGADTNRRKMRPTVGRIWELTLDFKIRSENTEALIRSAGSTSNASAISKNTSRENPWAMFGASIVLIRERLTPALSANFS